MFCFIIVECIVKQFIPGGFQHLGNHIFIEISKINRKLIAEQLFVNDVLGEIPVLEHQGCEQTCITEEKPEPGKILDGRQTGPGVIGMIGNKDCFLILHLGNQLKDLACTGMLKNA